MPVKIALSVRLYARNNSRTAEKIFTKSDVGEVCIRKTIGAFDFSFTSRNFNYHFL
jgi:hypothetical protein